MSPDVKKDKILSQFALIKDTKILNEINNKLGKTPLKYYVEFLNEKIYKSIKYNKSSEDYLGRFYGEFMSYSGGDGQALGIVLTPKHITDLFCDLVDIKSTDTILDPCCGTGGFLVASMHHMLEKLNEEKLIYGMQENRFKQQQANIKQKQLHGFELQPYMFTIATTNMILRGDGKSNLINDDFIAQNASKLQLNQSTVGMINPPYSQGSKQNPDLYEINFIKHLLDSLTVGGKCIAIIPQSSMTGKTKEESELKEYILARHTLEGVITLNKDTFYGVGTMPCIAIFTAGIEHSPDKECKFIDFRNDGYKISPHIGLIETEQAKDKKQHLLDVWFDRIESETKFCVKTTVEPTDEWLHSFYYFNDEIPSENDFERTISEYLTFEFSMIMQNREHLFDKNLKEITYKKVLSIQEKKWKGFAIESLFDVLGTITTHPSKLLIGGNIPRITCSSVNNGLDNFYINEFTEEGGVLTIDSATIGHISYQESDFIATDHVEKILLKDQLNKKINRYLGLGLIACIRNATINKFNYGYKFSQGRIKKQIILLPVNEKEDPDYEYIEQYTKNIMYKKNKQYLDYINKN